MTRPASMESSGQADRDDVLDSVRPPPPPPEIGALLDAELSRLTPARTRRPLRDALVIFGSGLAVAGALLAMMQVRRDLLELPTGWLVAMAVGWLLGFLVPAYLAVVPPRGQMIARWRAAAISAGVSAVLFVAGGLMIQPSGPSSAPRIGGVLHQHTCLELGLAAALVPVLLAAIAVRGAFPVGSRWAAAALGAASGALGGLLLHFHCSVADVWHVGVIHGGVVLVAAAISALVVPAATDRAFRRPS